MPEPTMEQIDAELKVMRAVIRELKKLPPLERKRVMDFLWDKYVMNPSPEP